MTIYKKMLDIVPSALASRVFGMVSDIEFRPGVQHVINKGFALAAHLDMDSAAKELSEYHSLNALFTRELREGVRPISRADVVSPVDGKVSYIGQVRDGMMIEAKGRSYSVESLMGTTLCSSWSGNAYVFTIYLSPTNYHRIHSPITGKVTHMSYVPGRLLPVNRIGYFLADDLLPENERLTSIMEDNAGHRVALVKVGATCVGRISVVYDDFRTNKTLMRKPLFRALEPEYSIGAGEQIGCFELGSTVVLFVESEGFEVSEGVCGGCRIKYGEALGNWK